MDSSLTPIYDEWLRSSGHPLGFLFTYPDDPGYWYWVQKLQRPDFDAIGLILNEFKNYGNPSQFEILSKPTLGRIRIGSDIIDVPVYGKCVHKYPASTQDCSDAGRHMITAFKYVEVLYHLSLAKQKTKNNNSNKNKNNSKLTRKQLRQKWYNLANKQ